MHYVNWAKPLSEHDLQGRSIQLDEENGVIYPSHFRPKIKFTKSIFVLHNAGVRVRKQIRETMPDNVLRLRDMVAAALEAEDEQILSGGAFDAQSCCAACGHSTEHGPLTQCCFCLLRWHTSCSKLLAASAPAYLASCGLACLPDAGWETGDLPFFFLQRT